LDQAGTTRRSGGISQFEFVLDGRSGDPSRCERKSGRMRGAPRAHVSDIDDRACRRYVFVRCNAAARTLGIGQRHCISHGDTRSDCCGWDPSRIVWYSRLRTIAYAVIHARDVEFAGGGDGTTDSAGGKHGYARPVVIQLPEGTRAVIKFSVFNASDNAVRLCGFMAVADSGSCKAASPAVETRSARPGDQPISRA